MDGDAEEVAARLTKLVGLPNVSVSADDKWMPRGKSDPGEVQLDKAGGLLPTETQKQLRDWWLAVPKRANTPNWDIASSCHINDERGLILVEAKAHETELADPDDCKSTNLKNIRQIGRAISEANLHLQESCLAQLETKHCWNLSAWGHYQLSNRFAWSWKLASLGVPVVLVYLGFLNADEMPDPFHDPSEWESVLRNYAEGTVNSGVWGERLHIGESRIPLIPLIRTCNQDFDPKNP